MKSTPQIPLQSLMHARRFIILFTEGDLPVSKTLNLSVFLDYPKAGPGWIQVIRDYMNDVMELAVGQSLILEMNHGNESTVPSPGIIKRIA